MNYQFADRINNLKPSAIREILKNSDPNVISLAAGNPAVESFPVAEMQEIANRIFNEEAGVAFQYGITEGYPRLRKLLRARLAEKFGMTNENDELLVVSGGQQGIDLATKVLCNEGDVIVSENPAFIGALNTFRSYAAVLKGVDVLEDGMDLDALEAAFRDNKNVKMLYPSRPSRTPSAPAPASKSAGPSTTSASNTASSSSRTTPTASCGSTARTSPPSSRWTPRASSSTAAA